MEGRRRLSARGRPRHRRPLLRHPCRQARRPAEERDGARRGGAGGARKGGTGRRTYPPPRRHAETPPRQSAAEALLREIRPDELTPREALEIIYRLKALATQ